MGRGGVLKPQEEEMRVSESILLPNGVTIMATSHATVKLLCDFKDEGLRLGSLVYGVRTWHEMGFVLKMGQITNNGVFGIYLF